MANYYSKQELIKALQELEKKLGRAPLPADMTEPSAQAVLGFFKKWPKAIKAAGLNGATVVPPVKATVKAVPETEAKPAETAKPEEEPCNRRYSKTIITKMLQDEFNRLGKKPTRKEIDENKDLPTVSTILKYFETTRIGDVWNEVLK